MFIIKIYSEKPQPSSPLPNNILLQFSSWLPADRVACEVADKMAAFQCGRVNCQLEEKDVDRWFFLETDSTFHLTVAQCLQE